MASSTGADLSVFKWIGVVCCVVVTSMFYFPFEFNDYPGMNTKKAMAAVALVILLFRMVKQRSLTASKDFIYISILAGLVSFCGMIAVTYNNTTDYAYAAYIMSAWVWWGAAYTVCTVIRWVHGRLDIPLVINYLAAVCFMQCCLALAIDLNPAFKQWVMSIFATGDMYFAEGNVQRMFGIGCALDVAGIHFALVLVAMFFMKMQRKDDRWYQDLLFYFVFFFILVVGNMIGRTTIVGVAVGFVYLALLSLRQVRCIEQRYVNLWKRALLILLVFVPIIVYFYQTNPRLRKNFRFGFEGFVSYVEKGEWKVTSNEKLKTMYVWPDNVKTWAIGDGYFDNPVETDPYYTGERTGGFYKNSDVGYVRFVFYFGLIGLVMFSFYMIQICRVCRRRHPEWRTLFLLLLAVHFIVWYKVATDTFLIFALFLCINPDVNDNLNSNENLNLNENEDSLSLSRHV